MARYTDIATFHVYGVRRTSNSILLFWALRWVVILNLWNASTFYRLDRPDGCSLQPLPFPDSHFDYVHIRRIARGVPEDKWPDLLEEVSRVLEPNGAVEFLEEDLIFPGGSEPCSCHFPPDWNGEDEDVRNEETMSSELSHQSPAKGTDIPFGSSIDY